MTWDDSKDTFQQRPEIDGDKKLTADEWNAHVADQKDHSDRHEEGGSDELNVDGLSGVLADAQTPQTEAVEDIVGALIAAGDKVGVTYDDAGNVLTIDTTALDEEEVEDAVAALVTAGNAITVNYDDANDALSIAVDESALSFYDGANLTAPVDNQSVNTGELNTTTRFLSSFNTLQEAGDATPRGGTLIVDGTFDVANIGVGSFTHPFTIRGTGWEYSGAPPFDIMGSLIENTGGDAVNSPLIEFSTSGANHAQVCDLAIDHDGDSEAIHIVDTSRSRIKNNFIHLNGAAPHGVVNEGDSFFFRAVGNTVLRFTDIGVWNKSAGFCHSFFNNHISTAVDNNPQIAGLDGPAALRIESQWSYILGGQHDSTNDNVTGVGVQFYNDGTETLYGGYVNTTCEKSEIAVDITGETNSWRFVRAENMLTPLTKVGTSIRFDRAQHCRLLYPVVRNPSGGGTLEEHTSNASQNIVVTDVVTARAPASDPSGSFGAARMIMSADVDSNIAAIDTTVPTTMLQRVSGGKNEPIWFDGTDWRAASSTTFTPS